MAEDRIGAAETEVAAVLALTLAAQAEEVAAPQPRATEWVRRARGAQPRQRRWV